MAQNYSQARKRQRAERGSEQGEIAPGLARQVAAFIHVFPYHPSNLAPASFE